MIGLRLQNFFFGGGGGSRGGGWGGVPEEHLLSSLESILTWKTVFSYQTKPSSNTCQNKIIIIITFIHNLKQHGNVPVQSVQKINQNCKLPFVSLLIYSNMRRSSLFTTSDISVKHR